MGRFVDLAQPTSGRFADLAQPTEGRFADLAKKRPSEFRARQERGMIGRMFERTREFVTKKTGLFAPDISPIGGPKFREERPFRTLAKAIPYFVAGAVPFVPKIGEKVAELTGFEPTPRERRAAKAGKFVTELAVTGAAVGPLVAKIPAAVAWKTMLASGLTFGGRKTTEEFITKIVTGKPVDWQGIHFEGGIGVLFGAGEVGMTGLIKFMKGFRALPKNQIRPARAEVNEAIRLYKETGDRTAWDAARIKYAGITPEGIERIRARTEAIPSAQVKVKDFGKYPIAKTVRTAKGVITRIGPKQPTSVADSTVKSAVAPIVKEKPPVQAVAEGKVPAVMRPGFVDLTPIAEAGETVAKQSIRAHKLVTRFTGLESKIRKSLIEVEEQERHIPKIAAEEGVKLFRELSNKESLQVLQAIEEGRTETLSPKLQKATEDYALGIVESGDVLKKLGYTADWPKNVIQYLKMKLKTVEGHKADLIAKRIEDLDNLSYVHHTYKPEGLLKKAIFLPRRITKRPSKLLGRKYDTLAAAIKAGKKPSHIAVSYAEMVAEARRAELHNKLINAVNQNTELALPENRAPSDWALLDERVFPSSKKQAAYVDERGRPRIRTTRYRYHPAIAEAIEELTYTPSKNMADIFVRQTYDKLNAVMKHILFYNPVIMTKNDIFQAWRATGFGFVTKLPKAIKAVATKNELYDEFRRAGLYNSVIDYTPSAKMLADNMIEQVRRTKGEKAAQILGHYINPYNILRDTKHLLDNITWGGDKIWRTAVAADLAEGSFFTKGLGRIGLKPSFMVRNKLSRFETIELANDFMANYGKVPKGTRKWANRFFFTPTYRISMARMTAKMWVSPKKFAPQLARHYAYKLFVWYVLPGLIGAWVYGNWKTGRIEKGYKIVLKTRGGKERVYTLSDPLLEEAKLTQRPLLQSFEYNIAAVPNLILGLLRKPKYKNKRDRFGHLFKLGTPIIRDVANMQDEDKTTAEKILTSLAITYVYTRKGGEENEDTAIESFAKAISIWTDWKAQKEDIQKRVGIETGRARKRVRRY